MLLARDTLSPALNLLWIGPTLLAARCIGRPYGRGAVSLLAVALVLATPMMSFSRGGSADNDTIGVFFLLAAVALLLSGRSDRSAEPTAYVLAAIAAGLAISVRLTLLAPVLGLTLGVIALAPRGQRRTAGARWLGPLALAGGYWYVRNLLSWLSFAGVLATPAPPLQQRVGYSVGHYLGDGRVWSHFVAPVLAGGLGGWWYLVLALAVIGPLLCLPPGASAQLRMLALVSLGSLAAYLITPESAMGPKGDPVGISYTSATPRPG